MGLGAPHLARSSIRACVCLRVSSDSRRLSSGRSCVPLWSSSRASLRRRLLVFVKQRHLHEVSSARMCCRVSACVVAWCRHASVVMSSSPLVPWKAMRGPSLRPRCASSFLASPREPAELAWPPSRHRHSAHLPSPSPACRLAALPVCDYRPVCGPLNHFLKQL